jgi:hypothetical protein
MTIALFRSTTRRSQDVLFGPFCRCESPTQTKADAQLQQASGEIWGRTPRGGMEPTVQAYPWPLAADTRGIEFTTDTIPHPNGSPYQIR